MLVAALIIGSVHLSNNKVKADNLITGVDGTIVDKIDDTEIDFPAVQYSFNRLTLNWDDEAKPAIKMALLIDMSSSMSGNRLAAAKTALLGTQNNQGFIEKIFEAFEATMSVYTFNSIYGDTEAVKKILTDSKDSEVVKETISGLDDDDTAKGTDISAGVKEALSGLSTNDFLVILSDGEASYATADDGTIYVPSWDNSKNANKTQATGNIIDTTTTNTLNAVGTKVKKAYAINFLQVGISGIQGIEIYNADSVESLSATFEDVSNSIKRNATSTKLVAEVGRYVDFDGIVGNGKVDLKTGEILVSQDEKGKPVYTVNELQDTEANKNKKLLVWSIADPDVNAATTKAGTSDSQTSPIVKFKINTEPEELIKIKNETNDPQIILEDNEDGSIKITLKVTATTVLTYAQTDNVNNENPNPITVTIPVVYFDTITAYESVAKNTYTVNYYKEVLTEAGKEKIGDTITITTYGEEVYNGPTADDISKVFAGLNDDNYSGNYTKVSGNNNWDITFTLKESTVNFVWDDEETPIDEVDRTGKVGQTFEVPADPKKADADGYKFTFKGWYKSDDEKKSLLKAADIVKTFGTEDVTYVASFEAEKIIVVPPTPDDVTVTVEYIYADETKAADSKTESGKPGKEYSITSPVIDGFTASKDVVSGIIPEKDVTIRVTYTAIPKEDPKPEPVTVTVEYKYADGTKAADDKTATNIPGTNYSIESPAIDGYTPSNAVISGIIPEKAVTITVTYTKNQPKQEDPIPTPEQKKNDPPIIYYVADPTPVPTADPTPVPTADPTPEPTQVPEEIEEAPEVPENVEVEIPETPEGEPEEIEIPAEPETPEGTPDDIEVELPDVPEGLPQTGTAPVAVFFGIGAACIILGGAMIVKIRRREEEM